MFFDTEDTAFGLAQLNKFLDENKDAETIDVYINSGGGSVTEGFAIYDKLSTLNAIVNTYANGMVGSIATVIFQAGKNKGKRKMYANSEFFVHNPIWIPDAPNAMDAKDLALLQEDLKKAEDKIKNFYADITGKSVDELTPILDRQTTLTAQEAIEFGFADEKVSQEISAFTKYRIAAFLPNHNKNSEMSQDLKNELTGVKKILAQIRKAIFKNAQSVTVDGVTVYYEGETLAEGTVVFLDEAMTELATGVHVIDGKTVTLDENGVVLTITEVAATDELTQANAKIAELQAALDAANGVVAETKTNIEVLAKKVTEFETKLVTGANFKAQGSQHEKDVPQEPKSNGEKLLEYRAAKAAAKK